MSEIDHHEDQPIDKRLGDLIESVLSGSIDQAALTELESILAENPEAQELYFQQLETDQNLRQILQVDDYQNRQQHQLGETTAPSANAHAASRTRVTPVRFRFVAAAVLIVAALLVSSRFWPEDSEYASTNVIAFAKTKSASVEWFIEDSKREQVNGLHFGDVVRVIDGRLELQYANGVTVDLDGPVACELVSEMELRMLLGSVTADVPESCRGFSVLAPRARVVDLGTKFRVDVDPQGGMDVVVFQGEVDVDNQAKPDLLTQRLRMGEGVHLDAHGEVSRIDSIQNNEFVDAGQARPVLIQEVSDNYDRNSSFNYYEIVQNGMREDALAFVDRVAHEWNGIDASGMPDYLVGGDYVRTFNNDKFDHQLRLQVKIGAPCNLYVLFDNRLPVTQWLASEFKDTGDDIGLDNGPFVTHNKTHNKGPSGIGPGQSIDDKFSVWVRRVESPTTVTLGSTESPFPKPNMYGIVAVPLDEE